MSNPGNPQMASEGFQDAFAQPLLRLKLGISGISHNKMISVQVTCLTFNSHRCWTSP